MSCLFFGGTILLGFVKFPGNAEQSLDSLSCHLLARASATGLPCRSGQGIPQVSVIVSENARLETSSLETATESFDGPTYYQRIFPVC